MAINSRVETKKLNGLNFDPWKLMMEDILVHKEQRVVVDLGSKHTAMSIEHSNKLERKERSKILLSLKFRTTKCF